MTLAQLHELNLRLAEKREPELFPDFPNRKEPAKYLGLGFPVHEGGFMTSGIKDRSVCTVIALANVTGWNYAECDRIANEAGRKRGHGFSVKAILDRAGIRYEETRFEYYTLDDEVSSGPATVRLKLKKAKLPTLRLFLTTHPRGLFIVCTADHAFVLFNSQILDATGVGLRSRVRYFFEITSIPPKEGGQP